MGIDRRVGSALPREEAGSTEGVDASLLDSVLKSDAGTRASILRALLLGDDVGVARWLFWYEEDQDYGYRSLGELVDGREWVDSGPGVYPVVEGVQLDTVFVAILPRAIEIDDGWGGGVGWLDCEAVPFKTYEEADLALTERRAALLQRTKGGDRHGRADQG